MDRNQRKNRPKKTEKPLKVRENESKTIQDNSGTYGKQRD